MKSLCIESSQSTPLLAIFDHETHVLIDSFELPIGKQHSSTVVLCIQALLKKANLSLNDLSLIACSLGPGSLIGTRVGLITAKSLSFALEIPLVTFCSLEIYEPFLEGPFMILYDVRSQGVYGLKGLKKKEEVVFEKAPQLYQEKDLESLDSKISLFSPDAEALKKRFSKEILQISPSFSLLEETICQKKFEPTCLATPFAASLSP